MSRAETQKTPDKPFLSIVDACKATGLSAFYLRKEIKAGRIASIRSGQKYMVNMPRLLESLNALPAGGDGGK